MSLGASERGINSVNWSSVPQLERIFWFGCLHIVEKWLGIEPHGLPSALYGYRWKWSSLMYCLTPPPPPRGLILHAVWMCWKNKVFEPVEGDTHFGDGHWRFLNGCTFWNIGHPLERTECRWEASFSFSMAWLLVLPAASSSFISPFFASWTERPIGVGRQITHTYSWGRQTNHTHLLLGLFQQSGTNYSFLTLPIGRWLSCESRADGEKKKWEKERDG